MKPSFTLLAIALTLCLSACYTWQPPPPGPGGPPRSLDQGPQGGNRYFNEPQDPANSYLQPGADGQLQPNGPAVPPPNGNSLQQPVPAPNGDNAAVPPPNNVVPPPNQPQPAPAPVPPPTAPSKPSLPFGLKVPNKPGFVYSPYDRTAGIVDVQGMSSGTKVKCPYTGKVFVVP